MYLVPSLSKVHLDVGETYEREGNPNKALKTYLGALEHFPTSWALLEKACSMLLVKEAYFKVIALLQDTKMMPEKPELPLLLIRAYLGIYDYQAAKRVVDRMTVMPDRKIVIPDDLIFLVQESVDRLVPPVGYEQNLEVLHQQEKKIGRAHV